MTYREGFITIQTTDGRYNKVQDGEWWDTTGIDIVSDEVVDQYLEDHPRVGMMRLFSPE